MTVKLDHHHRNTVEKVFSHPLNHNIQWHDVESLLGRFGEVHESHKGNWSITVDGQLHSFGSIHTRDLNEDQVMKVRQFLRGFGCTPQTLMNFA